MARGLFMGLSSTIIYTSELILCSTICVPSAMRHNIYTLNIAGVFTPALVFPNDKISLLCETSSFCAKLLFGNINIVTNSKHALSGKLNYFFTGVFPIARPELDWLGPVRTKNKQSQGKIRQQVFGLIFHFHLKITPYKFQTEGFFVITRMDHSFTH